MTEALEKFYEDLIDGTLNDAPGQLDRTVAYCDDRCSLHGPETVRKHYTKTVGVIMKNCKMYRDLQMFRSPILTPKAVDEAYQSTLFMIRQMLVFIEASDANIGHYSNDFKILIMNAVVVMKHLRKMEQDYGI